MRRGLGDHAEEGAAGTSLDEFHGVFGNQVRGVAWIGVALLVVYIPIPRGLALEHLGEKIRAAAIESGERIESGLHWRDGP